MYALKQCSARSAMYAPAFFLCRLINTSSFPRRVSLLGHPGSPDLGQPTRLPSHPLRRQWHSRFRSLYSCRAVPGLERDSIDNAIHQLYHRIALPELDDIHRPAPFCLAVPYEIESRNHGIATMRKSISEISLRAPKWSPVTPPNLEVKNLTERRLRR